MKFSLKALFVVVSLACIAAAFPKPATILFVSFLALAGLIVSWLMPPESTDARADKRTP